MGGLKNLELQSSMTDQRPKSAVSINRLQNQIKEAYKLYTAGDFENALAEFRNLLNSIPLLVLRSEEELGDVEQLKSICVNYIVALLCAIKRGKEKAKPIDDFKLLVLMALCRTEPSHRILALKLAMTKAYKMKNYLYCAQFAKKIL